MKILVVDDEPLARERLLRMLREVRPGASTREAGSGQEALALARADNPELVLLDISMPGMDGLAVAAALAQLEEPPAVIFCTAFDSYAVQAFEQQAVGYLVKPVREDKLRAAIDVAARPNRLQLSGLDEASPSAPRTHVSSDTHRGVERLAVSEVRYFLAEHKYVRACAPGASLLLADSLRDLEAEFGGALLRIHRNALVNPDHVQALRREGDQWVIAMDGVDDTPVVSRRHLSEVRERLTRA